MQAHALGLIPHWAADPSIGNRTINARAETLTELPSFKNIVDRRRCVIPADGFYEWRKEGKRKVPMWVYLKTKEFDSAWGLKFNFLGSPEFSFESLDSPPRSRSMVFWETPSAPAISRWVLPCPVNSFTASRRSGTDSFT